MTDKTNSSSVNALLLSLKINKWSGRRTDINATTELADGKKANAKAVKVIKSIVNSSAQDDINHAARKMRKLVDDACLDWGMGHGLKLLPAAKIESFTVEYTRLKAEFDKSVSAFVSAYPELVKQANMEETGLGDLFEQSDYPTADEVSAAYGCDLSWMQVPDAAQWRVDALTAETQSQLRETMQRQTKAALAGANQQLFRRLYAGIEVLKSGIESGRGISSRVRSGFKELVDSLRESNFTGDPDLEAMINYATSKLIISDELAANKDKEVRNDLSKVAADALNKLRNKAGHSDDEIAEKIADQPAPAAPAVSSDTHVRFINRGLATSYRSQRYGKESTQEIIEHDSAFWIKRAPKAAKAAKVEISAGTHFSDADKSKVKGYAKAAGLEQSAIFEQDKVWHIERPQAPQKPPVASQSGVAALDAKLEMF